MKINNVDFELQKERIAFSVAIEESKKYDKVNIDDCYQRSSMFKKRVYENWKAWFIDLYNNESVEKNKFAFGISSFNSQMFTLASIIKYEGVWYQLVITKLHNRAYVLDI